MLGGLKIFRSLAPQSVFSFDGEWTDILESLWHPTRNPLGCATEKSHRIMSQHLWRKNDVGDQSYISLPQQPGLRSIDWRLDQERGIA